MGGGSGFRIRVQGCRSSGLGLDVDEDVRKIGNRLI